jgi:NAD(P)-dependent dehydrogenase (short-subunit alcohol dehydrogenase family)
MDLGIGGKVAIVTGASRGIGRATAKVLAQEGASLVVAGYDAYYDYRAVASRGRDRSTKELDSIAEEIRAAGGKAVAVPADVTVAADFTRVAETAISKFGRIDILVNDAGVTLTKEFDAMTEEEWKFHIDVNLNSAWLGAKTVAPYLKKQRSGKIVSLSSESGKTPWPILSAYSAAKGGIVLLTMALAKELGPYDVQVNCVCPGCTQTPLQRAYFEGVCEERGISYAEFENQVRSGIPTGRLNDPEDIANTICFLASQQARQITGQAINVGGGDECH